MSNNLGGRHEVPSASRSVVVKRMNAEEKSAGGIIIPDTAKENTLQGEIIAVGLGVMRPAS